MKFALIEWLILAHSDVILHTHGSSFAMEVCCTPMLVILLATI